MKPQKSLNFSKNLNLGHKMHEMHEEREKSRYRSLTKELELGIGRNLEGRSFDEKKLFGLREKREESKYLSDK